MGKVSGNWITGAHSGRACHHEDIYTKVNKKTGACYSVKLCNPNDNWNENQLSARRAFGMIQTAISAWITENKQESGAAHADYLKVLAKFNAQNKYATLRGMMIAKGMYRQEADNSIVVDITANTDFKGIAGTASAADDSSNAGGATNTKYTLSLSASPSNGGTVSGAGSYAAGTAVNVVATPASGYSFTRWDDGNTSANRSVTMNADLSLTAVFTASSTPDAGGSEGDGESDEGNF